MCVFDAGKPAVIISRNSRRDVHLRFLPPSPQESTLDAVFKMRRHVVRRVVSAREGFLFLKDGRKVKLGEGKDKDKS